VTPHDCDDFRARIGKPLSDADAVPWHEHLARCAACRDRLAAEQHLDELLASVPAPRIPAALAERVRAALGPMREKQREEMRLDALLDAVPAPEVPADLARRVLAGLRAERHPRSLRFLRGRTLRLAAAAVVLFAALAAWRLFDRPQGEPRAPLTYMKDELSGDDELVVYALENWELLMSEELEVYLASLDATELAHLELDPLDDLLGDDEDEDAPYGGHR